MYDIEYETYDGGWRYYVSASSIKEAKELAVMAKKRHLFVRIIQVIREI